MLMVAVAVAIAAMATSKEEAVKQIRQKQTTNSDEMRKALNITT